MAQRTTAAEPSAGMDETLAAAHQHSRQFLDGLADRPVSAALTADEVAASLPSRLPVEGVPAAQVVDELVRCAEPGLVAMPSGRFFGWVTGGVLPAALGADWLTSTWDQNAMLRASSPAAAGFEAVTGRWLLQVLGLPDTAAVGFVTGATMANFTCLAAARHAVLARAGWDVEADGLTGAPRVRVVVGSQRHDSIPLALRYLGLGRPVEVPSDREGRLIPTELARVLGQENGPTIVCLQAGNVHSGAFDPFVDAIEVARSAGAWVHVDGAFGLWANASERLQPLLTGVERADSWATDAHKTLNVPHDCGVAIVADPSALHAAMTMDGAYLIRDGGPEPLETTPELTRRARAFPVWAALRQLGADGVANLVEQLADLATLFAQRVRELPDVEVLNRVDFTQLCIGVGDGPKTQQVAARLLAEGEVWITPSFWRGQPVLRVSMSNWRASEADVNLAVVALGRALG